MPEQPESARIFLITPPIADVTGFAPMLEAAVGGGDVACLLLRTQARDAGEAKTIIRALAPMAQRHDAAVLIENDPRLAARADADGVHIAGVDEALSEALAALRPDRIVGCGPLTSRHDAMSAGEANVDYLMFGAPGHGSLPEVLDWVSWWSDIFNVPCVGYAQTPSDAGAVARAGAEFVGLCEGLWSEPSHVAEIMAQVRRSLRLEAAAA